MNYAQSVRASLSAWVTFLLVAVPIRSRSTFIELLCGCLVSPEGWVTRVLCAIKPDKHWGTYYKLLERDSVRTLALARRFLTLVAQVLPESVLTMIIDDTLVPCHSTKRLGSAIRHDHAKKVNRPTFMQAQCWVSLAVNVTGRCGKRFAIPILSRLVPKSGNTNKLLIAISLVRGTLSAVNKPIRLLIDSWFMRGKLVLPLLKRDVRIIGQVRRDTALFLPPVVTLTKRRGRKRKYGGKLTQADIDTLPCTELNLKLYSKVVRVRIRSTLALARFLNGQLMRAIWCEFYDEKKGCWAKPRLLLASEVCLTPEQILFIYARRWGIEPLFHNLKRWWGMDNLWQQTRRTLELWMQIRSIAWGMVQMLALTVEDAFPVDAVAPWRKTTPLTAGMVAQWLRIEFTGLSLLCNFDRKSSIFHCPDSRNDPRLRC